MRVRFSRHASLMLIERGLAVDWIARTISDPAWMEPDRTDPALTRYFAPVPKRDGRWLRVVCRTSENEVFRDILLSRPKSSETGMPLTLSYDRQADAAYVRLSDEAVTESEEVRPGIVLDFDKDGHIVALELHGAGTLLARDTLAAA